MAKAEFHGGHLVISWHVPDPAGPPETCEVIIPLVECDGLADEIKEALARHKIAEFNVIRARRAAMSQERDRLNQRIAAIEREMAGEGA